MKCPKEIVEKRAREYQYLYEVRDLCVFGRLKMDNINHTSVIRMKQNALVAQTICPHTHSQCSLKNLKLCDGLTPELPRSGELRTQKLKSHLVRTQSLNVLPLKPGIGQYIAIHATLTARNFFLAYFYASGPFICIFSKPLLIFSCVGCG